MGIARLYARDSEGTLEDFGLDFDFEQFAGVGPSVGDVIVDPGAARDAHSMDPAERRVWPIVARYFQPKGQDEYIALVVEERAATAAEIQLLA